MGREEKIMEITHLKSPVSVENILNLKVKDIVTVSGIVFTGRSGVHLRLCENEAKIPIDVPNRTNVIWHLGPVVEKKGGIWQLKSAGATTSIRFEKWAPSLIRTYHVRAMIGKGTMGKSTQKACQEVGCVHLGKLGMTTGALYAQNVEKIIEVHWLEMGTSEALWLMKVENLGPFIVDLDAHGNMLYNQIGKIIIEKGMIKAREMLGLNSFTNQELGLYSPQA